MFAFQPIGLIRTPFAQRNKTPIQASRSRAVGRVELLPEYQAGLSDLDGFSHIIVLYVFHQCDPGFDLKVTPFLGDEVRGLFATRFPRRPNPIGLSVVRLLGQDGRVLHVEGVDMLDGSPLLDLKPYVPAFDSFPDAAQGWLAGRV